MPGKILVVDDDKDLLDVLQLLLTNHGFEVRVTSCGEKALDIAKDFKPNLILLDIYLEGIDGRDICREIKKNENTRHIPVILFSAKKASINLVDECNASNFISKPFDVKGLVETLTGHLPLHLN